MRETMRNHPAVRKGMHPAAEDLQSAFDNYSEKVSSEHGLTGDRAMSRDIETKSQVPHKRRSGAYDDDPFGNEEDSEVKYRTLRWW
jgi:hypothetical protein